MPPGCPGERRASGVPLTVGSFLWQEKEKEKEKIKEKEKDLKEKEKDKKTVNGHTFSSIPVVGPVSCSQCVKPFTSKDAYTCAGKQHPSSCKVRRSGLGKALYRFPVHLAVSLPGVWGAVGLLCLSKTSHVSSVPNVEHAAGAFLQRAPVSYILFCCPQATACPRSLCLVSKQPPASNSKATQQSLVRFYALSSYSGTLADASALYQRQVTVTAKRRHLRTCRNVPC